MRHLSSILAATIAAAATAFTPGLARADEVLIVPEPQPTQDSATVVTTTNHSAIISGTVTFGLSYGAAVLAASMSDTTADRRLYVPLLGPWLDLADRPGCPVEEQQCDSQTTSKILITVDGVFQAIGVVAIIYGILTPRRHSVAATDSVRVVPISLNSETTGLGLTGSF